MGAYRLAVRDAGAGTYILVSKLESVGVGAAPDERPLLEELRLPVY